MIRILGLDPGLRRTGWGIVAVEGSRLGFVACGAVVSDSGEALAFRLKALHDGLCAVIATHRPDEAAVEETFVNKDAAPPSSSARRAASRCWCRRWPASRSPNTPPT